MDDIPSSYIIVALIIATFLANESRSCIKACLTQKLDIPEGYFRYDRLRSSKEVRLLRLHAGAPWERLDCDIIQCPKEELPRYQAISYTWGQRTQSHLVWINNQPLRIPANAHEVLHRLRKRKKSRCLWIDSICIDQSQDGDGEKPQQLDMMGYIYSKATTVLVWLGDSGDSPRAVSFLRALSTVFSGGQAHFSRTRADWTALITLLKQPWFERIWVLQEVAKGKEVVFLYGPHMFKWETLIPVISGLFDPPLATLGLQLRRLTHSEAALINIEFPGAFTPFRQVAIIRKNRGAMGFIEKKMPDEKKRDEDFWGYDLTPPLSELLLRCGRQKATEPKDKIFALITLSYEARTANSSSNLFFDPYSTTLPVVSTISSTDYGMKAHELFIKVAMKTLTNESSLVHRAPLILLPSAGIGNWRKVQPIPSWVADWSSLPEATLLLFDRGDVGNYRASGLFSHHWHYNSKLATSLNPEESLRQNAMGDLGLGDWGARQYVHLGPEPYTIVLQGMRVDMIKSVVERVYDPHPAEPDLEVRLMAIIAWFDETLSLARSLSHGDNITDRVVLDAYWRTICGNRGVCNGTFENPISESFIHEYKSQMQLYQHLLHCIQRNSVTSSSRDVQEYENIALEVAHAQVTQFGLAMQQHAGHRCFAITEGGRMALVPQLSKPGDLICIFEGAQTPMLLRKSILGGGNNLQSRLDPGMWQKWFDEMYPFPSLMAPAPPSVSALAEKFDLVGECYVHGIMLGEMLRGIDEEAAMEKMFCENFVLV
jgi:Heterokaryon incompatibility protein (HET)